LSSSLFEWYSREKALRELILFVSRNPENSKLDGGLPKYFAIEVHVVTLQVKVFQSIVRRLLFAEIIFDAPRLACSETSGVHHCIWFEECPELIACDFVIFKEGGELFGCGNKWSSQS
jgi:hypothetical protein